MKDTDTTSPQHETYGMRVDGDYAVYNKLKKQSCKLRHYRLEGKSTHRLVFIRSKNCETYYYPLHSLVQRQNGQNCPEKVPSQNPHHFPRGCAKKSPDSATCTI